MKDTEGTIRLRRALGDIRRIAAAIIETAREAGGRMSERFSEAETQEKVCACLSLVDAVGICWPTDLQAMKDELIATQTLVMTANDTLAPLAKSNPEMIGLARSVELKIFDMLVSNDPLILLFARIAQPIRSYFASYLHREFVFMRMQLLAVENGEHDPTAERIHRKLDALGKGLRKCHANENEILRWVSDESERYQPKDGRRLNAIRHNMVYAAAQAIFNAEPERATGIGMQFFRTFKTTSGAYANFRSFMKQVHRTLSTFKPRS